jgi:hypothetical protein
MAHLNWLSSLKRRFDHVKVLQDDGHEDYEPTMVLCREGAMGRSFMVPLGSMWKYLEPKSNADMIVWDRREFDKMAQSIFFSRQVCFDAQKRAQNTIESAAVVYAEQMHENSGVLLCTAFSLFMACHVLNLTADGRTMAQLMLFIQDGLDELKNMPPAEPENKIEEGEVLIRIDGKTFHVPFETCATDIARENQ